MTPAQQTAINRLRNKGLSKGHATTLVQRVGVAMAGPAFMAAKAAVEQHNDNAAQWIGELQTAQWTAARTHLVKARVGITDIASEQNVRQILDGAAFVLQLPDLPWHSAASGLDQLAGATRLRGKRGN